MPVPYMGRTLKGWTSKTTIKLITQTIVDYETVESESIVTLNCNFQALKPAVVDRKPPEQRTWKWWSIVVTEGPQLNIDDIIVKDSKNYRIVSNNDWSESGFQKYEAIEDYTG